MSTEYRHQMGMSGREAADYGAVLTFANAAGETWSWGRTGAVGDVIQDACDAAIQRDPTNLCVCVSTPSSIYADLIGRPLASHSGRSQKGETTLLARAGCRHMIHPVLRGYAEPRTGKR